jgi:hypothetical protein
VPFHPPGGTTSKLASVACVSVLVEVALLIEVVDGSVAEVDVWLLETWTTTVVVPEAEAEAVASAGISPDEVV